MHGRSPCFIITHSIRQTHLEWYTQQTNGHVRHCQVGYEDVGHRVHPHVLEDDQDDEGVAQHGQEGDGAVQDGQQANHPDRLVKVHRVRHVGRGVGGPVLSTGLDHDDLLGETVAATVGHGGCCCCCCC